MKYAFLLNILFLCFIGLTSSSFPKSLFKKKNIMKSPRTLTNIRHLDEANDTNITSLNDTTNISLSVPTTVLLTSNITNEFNDTNNRNCKFD